MEEFRQLRVYQHAREFTRGVWRATRQLPWSAQKLVVQLDDACESIGSNIAEGCGRKNRFHGNSELVRYAHFSFGSANEADHRLTGLLDRDLLDRTAYDALYPSLQELRRELRAWNAQLILRDRGRISGG